MRNISTVHVERTNALNVCPACGCKKIGCDCFTGEIYCLVCGLVLL